VLVAVLPTSKSVATSGTDRSSRGSLVSLVRSVALVYIHHVQSCFAGLALQCGLVFGPGSGQLVEKKILGGAH